MATAEAADRRLPRAVVALSVALMLVVGGAVVLLNGQSSEPAPTTPSAERVTSSARHRFDDLAGLVAASDLVIVGEVIADEEGRLFGTPTDGSSDASAGPASAIRSHVLTLRVEQVLAGAQAPTDPDAVVLVEEEHTLADGTPLVVDGMRAGRVGDRGVWFLTASGDPEFPAFAVVSSQGRYLERRGGRLVGGDASDRLVREIEHLGATGLQDEVRRSADSG